MERVCDLTLVRDFDGESDAFDETKQVDLDSSKIHGEMEDAASGRFHRAAFHLRERLRLVAGESILAGLELVQEFKDQSKKLKQKIREKMRIRYPSGQELACHITADEFAVLVEKTRPLAVQFSRISSHWYSV